VGGGEESRIPRFPQGFPQDFHRISTG